MNYNLNYNTNDHFVRFYTQNRSDNGRLGVLIAL